MISTDSRYKVSTIYFDRVFEIYDIAFYYKKADGEDAHKTGQRLCSISHRNKYIRMRLDRCG